MARRSNVIVILGLAVFIVGAAATYFLVRDSGGTDTASSVAGGVPVLYAADNIPAGTSGSAALDAGLIKTKNVAPTAKPATALTDSTQLTGRTTTVGVPQGSVITDEVYPLTQTRVGTVKIPDGKNAFAVSLTNVPGVAGYVGAGDHVNIFGLEKADASGKTALVLQGVEVLSVNGANITPSPGLPGAADRVFLLAVTPEEAQHLAYLQTYGSLYFSLVPKDQAPVPPTPIVDPSNAFKSL